MRTPDKDIVFIHDVLIRNTLFEIRYGFFQFSDRISHNVGYDIVSRYNKQKDYDGNHKQIVSHLPHIHRKFACRCYADYFPPGISYCLDYHISFNPVKFLGKGTIRMIGMGYVIFLDQSCCYSLFHRMINNISVGITQIHESDTAVIYILKYLLYPAVIHINKKNSITNCSEIGKFDIS